MLTYKIVPFVLKDGGPPVLRMVITNPQDEKFTYDVLSTTLSPEDIQTHLDTAARCKA
jgi:hypothetical protein